MLQSVTNVMIGKSVAADASLSLGEVALFDQDKKFIDSVNDMSSVSSIYVGVCTGTVNVTMPNGSVEAKPVIDYSQRIDRNGHPTVVSGSYVAPTQDKVVITLTGATIVAGNRYVVRIVYKDIEAANFQFTHTYEVYATSSTASDLASALAKKINAHKNRRVKAEVAAAVLTLTAFEKNDNEGVESLNRYSIVNMEVSLYQTIPGALLANQPEAVPGATIVRTPGNPGKGYWKQVRDAELKNMGYKGQVFTGAYPTVEQKRMVEEGAEYNYITIESDNLYLSNDNQYIKNTPMTVEVYVPASIDTLTTLLGKWAGSPESRMA